MGVLGHGLGHLNLGFNPNGMDLRFRNHELMESIKVSFVNIFAFASIFKGVMPFASFPKLLLAASIATVGLTVFDIEPKANFIYAQAVIYMFQAIKLSKEHKDTAAYMLAPFLNLPVLVVGVMESTGCEVYLKYMGGHAVFDSTIAIGIIMIELFSNRLQQPVKQKTI